MAPVIIAMLLAAISLHVSSRITIASENDKTTGIRLIQKLPHKNHVQGLAWSFDGSKLATLSNFGMLVAIWNTRTWEKEREIHQYSAGYAGSSIAWTAAGNLLTSAGARTQNDGIYSMNLWNPVTGALVKRIEGPPIPDGTTKHNQAATIAVSRKGSLAAIILGHIRSKVTIFEAPDWSIRRIVEMEAVPPLEAGSATAITFAPDDRSVIIANGGNLQRIDLQDGRVQLSINAYQVVKAVGPVVKTLTASPDGKYLASGPIFFPTPPEQNSVRIWNAVNGELIRALPGSDSTTRSIDWSPDGTKLAVTSSHKFRIWNVKDLPKVEELFTSDNVAALALAFSPDGYLAVTDNFSVLILK